MQPLLDNLDHIREIIMSNMTCTQKFGDIFQNENWATVIDDTVSY